MRIRNLNNSAFTLLEVLLASIIFVISVAGVFSTLNSVRLPVTQSESALAAAVFGKQVLEALRSQVNSQSTSTFYGAACPGASPFCTDFGLELGIHQVACGSANLPSCPSGFAASNPNGVSYTVTCASTGSSAACGADIARRLDLNINW